MADTKFIGLDVHKTSITAAVLNDDGKLVMQSVLLTQAGAILAFIRGISGTLRVTFEESTHAAWLYDLLKPQVAEVLVCDPRKNGLLKSGNKSDHAVHAPCEAIRLCRDRLLARKKGDIDA